MAENGEIPWEILARAESYYYHCIVVMLWGGVSHLLTGDWNLQDWKMTDEVAGVEFRSRLQSYAKTRITMLITALHSLRRLLLWVESKSSSPWMSTTASEIACGGNNGKATRQCTPVGSVYGVITVVNAKNLRLSCHCFILALLIAVVDFSQTCLLLTYV